MGRRFQIRRIPAGLLALVTGIFLFQMLLLPWHGSAHGHAHRQAAEEECRCELCLFARALDPASAAAPPRLDPGSAWFHQPPEWESRPALGWIAPAQARGPPAPIG